MVKKESHSKDIFTIPEFYKVIVENIVTDENPRYHTTTVLWVHYNYYSLTLTYLNKGNGYFSYELIVNFSNPKFYELGDPRIKPLPPMYETSWDYDETLHVFQKEYQSIEESAADVNFYLANAKNFEETLLENVSGFDTKITNDISIEKKLMEVFTNPTFEQHRFTFNKMYDEKELNTANYSVFEFEKNGFLFHIALNNHRPYYAMLKDFKPTNLICEFYGMPVEQAYALCNVGYTFPTNILELSLGKPFTDKLTEVEIKQIKYWKAKTIGELFFNKWD